MKKFYLTAALLAACLSAGAKVELPDVISSDMVLQRNSGTYLWGKAAPDTEVSIMLGWQETPVSVMSDSQGKWKVYVETPDAGGPYEIVLDDGEKTVLDNVLIGEVWLCSGQSNMEMPMKGFATQPVAGSIDYIVAARPDTPVRICNIQRAASDTPAEDCRARWMVHTPENVAEASAAAYYFAMKIHQVLDVPVGIIVSSWGGSTIRAWLDKATYMSLSGEFAQQPETWSKSTTMFNGMIAPLTSFNIRGLLWYQGESDIPYAGMYRKALPAYAEMMRSYWNNPEMPFYYVQLAPHGYGNPAGTQASELMEAQMLCLQEIPCSGMVTTLDIGDADCIHPARKEQVGNRLAYLALSGTYGIKGIDAEPPVYESWGVKDGRIIVTFKTGPLGVAPRDHILGGFEVAGEDHVFYPATAKVCNDDFWSVEVFCKQVKNPVAIRYCFHNVAEASLFNNYGIPASPFRTDVGE